MAATTTTRPSSATVEWLRNSQTLAPHFKTLIHEYDHYPTIETETSMTENTAGIFEQMMTDDRWLGFGYLGERRNQLAIGHADAVAAADAVVIATANRKQLSDEQLFEWANSKNGRWFADCYFGSHTHHTDNQYLP
jgi:hypothetical protein